MVNDFDCDAILSGEVEIQKLLETTTVLAYCHTKPFWSVHIVVIPKNHVDSLVTLYDNPLLIEIRGCQRSICQTY